MKVHVFSYNIILLSSPQHFLRPSYPFWRNFGRSGKGSLNEKATIDNGGAHCRQRESTSSKLQYDPDLISVACSYTELSISEEIWAIR